MTSHREHQPHYITATDDQIDQMLKTIGLNKLEELYKHIDSDLLIKDLVLPKSIDHAQIKTDMTSLSQKNKTMLSFIGDGLHPYKQADVVAKVCSIRGLTTAYTPYQPERSQGTLQTLWIYQSAISAMTGFEAVNASFYERSTCLYEAINCGVRIKKNHKSLVSTNIYPGDLEVIQTQKKHTKLEIDTIESNKQTGLINLEALESKLTDGDYSSFSFSQISNNGLIENVDAITDLCHKYNVLAIGLIDPVALSNTGLKEPVSWGEKGADMIVAEGQHLTLNPNFGGPGLGIFAIRFNDQNKAHIRSTAGRYIGKAVDEDGNECKSIILSTREQHIRREKATSNICSNQSFIASACGASILERGSEGFSDIFNHCHELAKHAAKELTMFNGVDLLYKSSFYNEITLTLSKDAQKLLDDAKDAGILIGVNTSKRTPTHQSIKLCFTDIHTKRDIKTLTDFFSKHFDKGSISSEVIDISSSQKRKTPYTIPSFSSDDIYNYYSRLGDQNLSPDESIYPLGSCTMKYNPEINDWAASLDGFTLTHPQAPQDTVQGNLELLFEIQQWFKKITGLPAVTTQPVAGAQGELVGLKMFQDYHADHGQKEQRNLVLIPRSAHGTNPATATMAGYETKKLDGIEYGIKTIEANQNGEINLEQVKEIVKKDGSRIAGIMITNPNTSGIFETNFQKISELIHKAGGLVYMDGANMNAIAGWVDLGKLGVDAVHNNLHKTWSIPHGGGGPGDAIVAVSEKLIDYLPGIQVFKEDGKFTTQKPMLSIGSFHRHFGNFAHKVRTLTYLKALGHDGIKRMSAVAVLSARYLYHKLKQTYPILPANTDQTPRMHEFILSLSSQIFDKAQESGTPKSAVIAKVGKLFLDFGYHAPTVAFPEVYGLMVEPTESYSKDELDHFCEVVETIFKMVSEYPQILTTTPHFTPIRKVNEIAANRKPILSEPIPQKLWPILEDKISPSKLRNMSSSDLIQKILEAHKNASQKN